MIFRVYSDELQIPVKCAWDVDALGATDAAERFVADVARDVGEGIEGEVEVFVLLGDGPRRFVVVGDTFSLYSARAA